MCFTIFVQKHGRMYIAKAADDLNTMWHFTYAVFHKTGKLQPPNEYLWSDLNKYSTLSQCSTLIFLCTQPLNLIGILPSPVHFEQLHLPYTIRGLGVTEFSVWTTQHQTELIHHVQKKTGLDCCDRYSTSKHLLFISFSLGEVQLTRAL